jgi:bifunctional DNA-binding transcriptional regulator/antitoxin component of YhaV-PrlF toxin-antitoxin module
MLNRSVKLTKSINRRVGKETYYKYIVTIPQKILNNLGWDENTHLEFKVDNKELKIKKK